MMSLLNRLRSYRIKSRDSHFAWITLLASTSIAVCSVGFNNVYSICFNAFLEKYGESRQKTAWLGSISYSLMFLLGPVASWIVNKLGLRLSTMLAALPVSASLLLTSYMTDFAYLFATFSIPFGVGSSVLLMASVKAICVYFDKWLSIAYGLSTGFVAILLVGLSYLLVGLIDQIGIDKTFRILSLVFFITCLVAAQAFLPVDFSTDRGTEEEKKEKEATIYLKLLRNKRFAIFLSMNFIFSFSYAVSYVHQIRMAIEKGVSEGVAKQFPVFTSIGIGLGRIFTGLMLDLKVKDKIAYLQFFLLLYGLICFSGLIATQQAHFIVYIWLFGLVDGIVQASIAPSARSVVGLFSLSEAYSLIVSADAIALLLGPPLVGFLVDKTNDYNSFFYISGTPCFLAFLQLILLRCFKSEAEGTVNVEADLEVDKPTSEPASN